MLKEVRFEGFGSRPDILAHLRELLPDLEQEIGRWGNHVGAELELRQASSDHPAVFLTLTMTLSHSKASNGGAARFSDIERPADFRAWVRRVWGTVLDKLLEQLDKLLEQRAKESELEVMPSTGG